MNHERYVHVLKMSLYLSNTLLIAQLCVQNKKSGHTCRSTLIKRVAIETFNTQIFFQSDSLSNECVNLKERIEENKKRDPSSIHPFGYLNI